jgi:hypothetical protein
MNVTYEKDKSSKYAKVHKTAEFYPFDLGDLLIGALLEANLAEPLDTPQFSDLSADRKQKMRETF